MHKVCRITHDFGPCTEHGRIGKGQLIMKLVMNLNEKGPLKIKWYLLTRKNNV